MSWPTPTETEEPAQLLQRSRPIGHLLLGVFAVVDNGRFKCPDYFKGDMQKANYEGYMCSEEVTNLFLFDFTGNIIHAAVTAVNYPCSLLKRFVTCPSGLMFLKLLDRMTPPGRTISGYSVRDEGHAQQSGARKEDKLHGAKFKKRASVFNRSDFTACNFVRASIC